MSAPDEANVAGAAPTTLVAVGALLESPVTGRAGQRLGKITEVMLTAGEGKIAYVVVASGGVLGVGETLHAVPWPNFTIDPLDGHVGLDIAQFDAASAFDKDHWPAALPDSGAT